jgi:Raf kinase inhibitor-like YbhB/YbcL family protein
MKAFLIIIAAALTATSAIAKPSKFTLISDSIKAHKQIDGEFVFNGFGCTGKNSSPDFTWKNAPKNTKAFAFTVYDPDAPTGSGWWHWVVYNIPAEVNNLEKNVDISKILGAKQGRTDFGSEGYGGPCPPIEDKKHRYVFRIFALKDKIEVPQNATAALIGFMLNKNKISEASITATYDR